MSETEMHTGTAVEICQTADTFIEKVNAAKIALGMKVEDIYEDDCYLEAKGFCYVRGINKLFKIDNTQHDLGDVCIATKDGDTYTYTLSFYNGGCPFSEALESAITEADKI